MTQNIGWQWMIPMVAGGLCFTAALQLWQIRRELRIKLIMMVAGVCCVWAVANSLVMLSQETRTKVILYTLHGDAALVLAIIINYVARVTAQPQYRPDPRRLAALAALMTAFLVYSFSDHFRDLLFKPGDSDDIFLIPGLVPGPACWLIFFVLPYGIFAYNIFLFLRAIPHLPRLEKLRAYSFVAGIAVVGLSALLYYVLGITPLPGLDPSASALGIAAALIMFSTYYFRGNWAEMFLLGGEVKNLDEKFFTYRLSIIIVMPAGFIFDTMAFLKGQYVSGVLVAFMLAVMAAGFALMQESLGSASRNKIFFTFFSLVALLFGVINIYTVGLNNDFEKIPWSFLFPVIAIHGLGPVVGLAVTLVFLLFIALAAQWAGGAIMAQHAGLWIRYFLSVACLTIILCFMELARRKYVSLLTKAGEELRQHRDSLEELVDQRTQELNQSVQQLRVEVAERKKSEAALLEAKEAAEAADRAKTGFLANMSHELRTPLTHILGFSDLMKDGYAGPLTQQQEEYLRCIVDSSHHLHNLINDLLDMTTLGTGHLQTVLAPVFIEDLIKGVANNLRPKAATAGVQMEVVCHQLPAVAWLDEQRLKQVARILMDNAIKFSPGGKVLVEVWGRTRAGAEGRPDDKPLVELIVSDTGIGIKPEDMERIFNPFEQVDPSLTRRFDGAGLGLALARRLVEMQGGRIWAESPGADQGSTFHVTLPLNSGPPEA